MSDYCEVSDVTSTWLSAIDTTPLLRAGAVINDLIITVIPVATSLIDTYLGQSILRQTRMVRLEGTGMRHIQLQNFPIVSLTSLKVYFGWENLVQEFTEFRYTQSAMLGLPPTSTSAGSQVIVERDSGLVTIDWANVALQGAGDAYPLWSGSFDRDTLNIEAVYTCGFEAIPPDVKAAAAMLCAMLIGEMAVNRSTQGASSISIGSVSKTWGARPYAALFSSWERIITKALQRFCLGGKAVNSGWASQG